MTSWNEAIGAGLQETLYSEKQLHAGKTTSVSLKILSVAYP